jgi:hypothetical protein
VYALRLFGIRTVIVGAELLARPSAHRHRAVRLAPLIHASDTAAAYLAGRHGHLPPRAARTAVAVSGVNTVLALVAQTAQTAQLSDSRGGHA